MDKDKEIMEAIKNKDYNYLWSILEKNLQKIIAICYSKLLQIDKSVTREDVEADLYIFFTELIMQYDMNKAPFIPYIFTYLNYCKIDPQIFYRGMNGNKMTTCKTRGAYTPSILQIPISNITDYPQQLIETKPLFNGEPTIYNNNYTNFYLNNIVSEIEDPALKELIHNILFSSYINYTQLSRDMGKTDRYVSNMLHQLRQCLIGNSNRFHKEDIERIREVIELCTI